MNLTNALRKFWKYLIFNSLLPYHTKIFLWFLQNITCYDFRSGRDSLCFKIRHRINKKLDTIYTKNIAP